MTDIASGVGGELRYKKQSARGSLAGTSGGRILRRLESPIGVKKGTYRSAEKTTSKLTSDLRHGVIRPDGTIRGEISPATYIDFIAACCRKDPVAGVSSGALTNVTAAAGPPGTFTRASGSWITDGFKVGDVVRWSGWGSGATANNARNYRITALTALIMTVGTAASGASGEQEAVAAKASGDSVTVSVTGKKTMMAVSAHTSDLFTLERWFPEIGVSLRFKDAMVTGIVFQMPAEGMCTIEITMVCSDGTKDTAVYFTAPSAETTSAILGTIGGFLRVNAVDVAAITSLTLRINLNVTGDGVAFSRYIPQMFYGKAEITGEFVAGFIDGALLDLFYTEAEFGVSAILTTGPAANADFLAFVMPRCKMADNQVPDPDGGLFQTVSFEALDNTAGGSGQTTDRTALAIQDSAA